MQNKEPPLPPRTHFDYLFNIPEYFPAEYSLANFNDTEKKFINIPFEVKQQFVPNPNVKVYDVDGNLTDPKHYADVLTKHAWVILDTKFQA